MKAFTIEELLRVAYSRHRRPFDLDCNAIQCAYAAGHDALTHDVEVVSNLLLHDTVNLEQPVRVVRAGTAQGNQKQ
jgi:hypothetical protein